MREPSLRLVVMISGNGSNLQAILDNREHALASVDVCGVISDQADALGLQRARNAAVPTTVVTRDNSGNRDEFDRRIGAAIDAHEADLVILAGFMHILRAELVQRYRGRMLNIHPSLLPRYRGLHTHRRAIQNGDPIHGTSVHYVTPELDSGPVIAQAEVAVLAGDDERSLSARVQEREHIIYPRVINWIATGRLAWHGERPIFDGKPLEQPILWKHSSGPEDLP